ncbi:lytic enzyme [Neisseria dentiae]|uniref:lytic enzyme n=1 Tax=Neisseria dentiae TaxID=194197 RepID=UPI0035A1A9E4
MEVDDDFKRAHNLVVETSRLMSAYQENSEKVVNDVRHELDKSLNEQRKMITKMVREELTKEATQTVQGYVNDMEAARNQMVEQVREFNSYLRKVQEDNKKISTRSVTVVSLTLAALVVGGIALFWFYSSVLQNQKVDADMVSRINQADIVRCGDGLCAKTGKAGANGYRLIQKR